MNGIVTQHVADGETHALDPRWVRCQRHSAWISSAVVAGLIAVAAAAAIFLAYMPALPVIVVAGSVAAISTGFSQWWPAVDYRHASYRLAGPTLEIRRGVIWRNCIDVPRSRIQHSDVSQGPIERRYGLATLSVYTAGTVHSEVRLKGLAHERALEIRAYLMQAHEDDVI